MNDRASKEAVRGGIQNGGTVDLRLTSDQRSPSSRDDAQRTPTFRCSKATLISEIIEGQSEAGPKRDLAANNRDRCTGHSVGHVSECVRDEDGNGERPARGDGKKLVKSLCSSVRRSSSPNFSSMRKTNDLSFDVRNADVDRGLAGSALIFDPRTSDVGNYPTPDLANRILPLTAIQHGTCKRTHHNTVQTQLVSCPRISVEKTLGAVDDGGVVLEPTVVHADDRPLRAVDDLNLATKNKITATRHRKISIPLLKPPSSSLEPPNARGRSVSPARRKFSNVSDAVSRKISTTIGWRSRGTEEVVPQAKYLCSQYIRCRLRRAGLLHKKIGLQRIRSVINLQWGVEACEVFPRLLCLGQELERSHPQLYSSVVRQLSISLKSDKVVRHVVLAISAHLLRTDITWAKIISLYAISAALAADCVKQGHPEFVSSVVEGVGMAIEQHSGQWIVSQGGWSGVLVWSQPPAFELTPLQMLLMIGAAGVSIAALIGGVISLLDHLMS